jgi:hypothetical protein
LNWRVCERFGRPPSWFDELTREDQERALAYERGREQEETG